MRFHAACLLAFVLALGGCGSAPAFYPLGSLVPLESAFGGEVKTTQLDRTIHRQKIGLGGYALLTAPVAVPEYSVYRRSVNIGMDDLLYKGMWFDGKLDFFGYCTMRRTARSYVLMGEGFDLQTCFRDPDNSGKFTRFSLNFGPQGTIFDRRDLPFASGQLTPEEPLPAPVGYRVVQAPPEDQKVDLAIRYNGEVRQPALEIVYFIGEKEEKVGDSLTLIPKDRPYPFEVDVRGARIEVIGIDDGVMRYRVLSGFRTDVPSLLNLSAPGDRPR